jgi:hypothetical protein
MSSRCAFVLALAGLALASAARASIEIDFNPNTGTFGSYYDSNPGCRCTVTTYTGNGIVAASDTNDTSPNIRSLLVNHVLNTSTWFLSSGSYYQETGIELADGGAFKVDSFDAAGCNGTLQGYTGGSSPAPIPGASFAYVKACSGDVLDNVSNESAWPDLTYLDLDANCGVCEPPLFYLTDLVIDPLATAPEPTSLALLGASFGGIRLARRRRNIPARLRNPGVLFGDGMELCVRPRATCGEGPCRGHLAPIVVTHSLDGGDIGRSVCSIRALAG